MDSIDTPILHNFHRTLQLHCIRSKSSHKPLVFKNIIKRIRFAKHTTTSRILDHRNMIYMETE